MRALILEGDRDVTGASTREPCAATVYWVERMFAAFNVAISDDAIVALRLFEHHPNRKHNSRRQ